MMHILNTLHLNFELDSSYGPFKVDLNALEKAWQLPWTVITSFHFQELTDEGWNLDSAYNMKTGNLKFDT